jgi:eukaryotic-like serine/threonine-protein kinase
VALRVFVASRTDISEGQIIAAGTLIVVGFAVVIYLLDAAGYSIGDAWWKALLATIFAGAVVAPLALAWRDVRRLAKAGFRPEDLARAFQEHLDRRREDRSFEHGGKPSVFERIIRLAALVSVTIAATTGALLWSDDSGYGFLWGWLGISLTIGLGSGLIAVMRVHRRTDLASRMWKWIWSGPVGRAFYWLATIGKKSTAPASLTHRSTELSLGIAVDDLFGKLPKDSRSQLRDLPDVVRRLEADAQRMRRRLEVLHDALANGGRPADDAGVRARHDRIFADLTAERELVQKRLADAVAALETIRLNLLRLHAGTGSVHSLTTDLGLAREVAEEIGLLLEGTREVEEELGS